MGPKFMAAFALALAIVIAIVIVIVFTFAMAGLVRGLEYRRRFDVAALPPRVRLREVAPALKTGDLLLFTAAVHGFTNSMLACTFFSHCGVVLRDAAGELFIAESTLGAVLRRGLDGEPVRLRNGADLSPLFTRLENYCGLVFLARLERELGAKEAAAITRAAAQEKAYPSLVQLVLGGGTTAHCFQHVHALLAAGGLVPEARPGPLEVCHLVCDLPRSADSAPGDGKRFAPLVLLEML